MGWLRRLSSPCHHFDGGTDTKACCCWAFVRFFRYQPGEVESRVGGRVTNLNSGHFEPPKNRGHSSR